MCREFVVSNKALLEWDTSFKLSEKYLNVIIKHKFRLCCSLFTIRLSIFLTLARACDKRFSADHDTMLSLLIKVFGPWAFTFYQTVFFVVFSEGKWPKH